MADMEKRFKKGEIICRPREMVMSMYNIVYGSVGVFYEYGTPDQISVLTVGEGDFFNIISFLESRPRNTTVVALEPTIVHEINYDNFTAFFREKPAKIMSLLQHMSGRMRQLQKTYVETCRALEAYGDKEKLQAEHSEWMDGHDWMYSFCGICSPSSTPRRRPTAIPCPSPSRQTPNSLFLLCPGAAAPGHFFALFRRCETGKFWVGSFTLVANM